MSPFFFTPLSNSYMKTPLLDFVFHIAAACLTLVTEHLGKHPLEGVVTHHATRLVGNSDRLIPIITYIERRAVTMA